MASGARQGVDICIVLEKDVVHVARVLRQAGSLARHGWHVVVIGLSRDDQALPQTETVDGFTIIRVRPKLIKGVFPGKLDWVLRTLVGFLQMAFYLRRINARVYQGKDFTGLALVALAGIWRRPVVYDSAELYFERPMAALTRRLAPVLRPIEEFLARRAAFIITTSEGHADFLRQKWVVQPVAVRNGFDLRATSDRLPVHMNTRHVVAHSGWLIHGRHLDELVDALQYLPDDVGLLLVGDGVRKNSLKQRAEALGVGHRLEITGRLLPSQMVGTLAQATVAVSLFTSDYASYHLSLPNKFFEAVAAGLPLVTSPIPEVQRLVEDYEIGGVCDPADPKSIAQAVVTVLEPETLDRMRANVLRAQQVLNWETEERKLLDLYEKLFQWLTAAGGSS